MQLGLCRAVSLIPTLELTDGSPGQLILGWHAGHEQATSGITSSTSAASSTNAASTESEDASVN